MSAKAAVFLGTCPASSDHPAHEIPHDTGDVTTGQNSTGHDGPDRKHEEGTSPVNHRHLSTTTNSRAVARSRLYDRATLPIAIVIAGGSGEADSVIKHRAYGGIRVRRMLGGLARAAPSGGAVPVYARAIPKAYRGSTLFTFAAQTISTS
jgi:hypothetical protein